MSYHNGIYHLFIVVASNLKHHVVLHTAAPSAEVALKRFKDCLFDDERALGEPKVVDVSVETDKRHLWKRDRYFGSTLRAR